MEHVNVPLTEGQIDRLLGLMSHQTLSTLLEDELMYAYGNRGWIGTLLPALRLPAGGTALFGRQSNKRPGCRLRSGLPGGCNRGATGGAAS